MKTGRERKRGKDSETLPRVTEGNRLSPCPPCDDRRASARGDWVVLSVLYFPLATIRPSQHVEEWKGAPAVKEQVVEDQPPRARGLHSSTSPLNLSRA